MRAAAKASAGISHVIAMAVVCVACSEADVEFSDAERAIFGKLSPVPELPPDPTNKHADDPGAALLGQRFFFETGWTGTITLLPDGSSREISCSSCHQGDAFDDPLDRNVSPGAAGWQTRNAPPLVNSSFYKWGGWAGRFDSQWSTPLVVLESPKVFSSTRLKVVHVVFVRYRAEYEALFGAMEPAIGTDLVRFPPDGKPKDGAWEGMQQVDRDIVNEIFANVGKAIAAYCRLLVSRDAPFDAFVAGDSGAITRSAQRGLKLFIGTAGCVNCHDTPQFSDDGFHNLGIRQSGEHVPATDEGRMADGKSLLGSIETPNYWSGWGPFSDDRAAGGARQNELEELTADAAALAAAKGAFRTKGLRQIAQTAPYMHAGQYATLRDVIEGYDYAHDEAPAGATKDSDIVALNLTDAEVSDLVEFLESLTGEPVDPGLAARPSP